MRSLLERVLQEETGAAIVIVAGFLPVAIALAAFVIDVGNAMEHRRHLQLQADAGAYAAASEFNGCGSNPDLANEAIRQKAIEYAATKNALLGDDAAQARVRTVINGTAYEAADFSDGTPCETGFVDVKVLEEDSPAFFGFVGSHDYRARARVQIFNASFLDGLLPLAMPVPDPTRAQATFVDETNGGAPLLDTNGDPIVADLIEAGEEDGLSIWKTGALNDDGTISANPVDVPVPSEHVGVRIALSGGASTDCANELVTCYDAGSANGLLHIRGWSSDGTVSQNLPPAWDVATAYVVDDVVSYGGRSYIALAETTGEQPDVNPAKWSPMAQEGPQDPPLLRSASLSGGTCAAPSFSAGPACTVNIVATVDFGGDPDNVGARLYANGSDMTYDADEETWSGPVSIPSTAGPVDIKLDWEETKGKIGDNACRTNNSNPCKGSFSIVQRHFSAVRERSGPIALVEVSKDGSSANSLQVGETHSLNVKVGIEGELELAPPNSPVPQYMRIAGDSGSQTQALDCNANGAGDFRWEMVLGCTAIYTKHRGAAPWAPCPDAVAGMAQPWQCVEVTTGDRTNNPAAALNERILGHEKPTVCPGPGLKGHNNWPYNPGDPTYPDDDPRKVSVFLTRFNAFEGRQGNFTVPITGFATFYITGWTSSGGGFDNPCQNPGNGDEIPRDAGELVGRYITSIQTPNDTGTGGGGAITCTFEDINPCTAVLVD